MVGVVCVFVVIDENGLVVNVGLFGNQVCWVGLLVLFVELVIGLFFCFFVGGVVVFLNFVDQFIFVVFDLFQVIVGEFVLLFFGIVYELFLIVF